jgi:glycosyltransferase involved in cell wall biosynthesis
MHVLIYEPQHTGHHLPYLARLLPALLDLPIRVTLATTRETVASDEFHAELEAFLPRLRVIDRCEKPEKGRPARYAFRTLRELSTIVREEQPDHLLVMYGDALWIMYAAMHATTLGLCGRRLRQQSSEAILYRGGFTYPDAGGRGNPLKRLLFRHALRSRLFDRWHLDDEIMHDFASRTLGARSHEVTLPPNPVNIEGGLGMDEARRELGLSSAGRIMSLSGAIARYKGADRLLRAFAKHLDARERSDTLVLAGPHEDEVRDVLADSEVARHVASGRIVSIDRFLSAHEMFLFAAAADVVAAPYPNHSGRSSIILWAAAAGRPVLATARGTIGFVTREHGMGMTVDPRDGAAFVDAIGDAFEMPWSRSDERRVRLYAREHSFQRYQSHMSRRVRELLGNDDPGRGAESATA